MLTTPQKPDGCIIQEEETPEGMRIYWQGSVNPWMRFGMAGFLAFWLCGWAFGEILVAGVLFTGLFTRETPVLTQVFLGVWLGGWTLGGAFTIHTLWKLLRPTRPEIVLLEMDRLCYDPGTISPLPAASDSHNLFPKSPKPVQIAKEKIPQFLLDRVGERQRLSFDVGADRVEIGNHLREPEREWLYQILETWRTI